MLSLSTLHRSFFILVFMAVSGSGIAAAALPSLEKCYGPYRIQSYLEVATALQALPEEERVALLRTWAGPPAWHSREAGASYPDREIILLCQLLFQPRAGGVLRRAGQGMPQFVGERIGFSDADPSFDRRMADEPLHWVDDIPFLVVRGYSLGGLPESGASYLDYCINRAEWTTRRFASVGTDRLAPALERLLAAPPWTGSLPAHEKTFLADQLLPYRAPVFEEPGLFADTAGSTRGLALNRGPVRLDSGEFLRVSMRGGRRPYRYTLTLHSAAAGEARVIDEGVGRTDLADPFARESLVPRWPDFAVGDTLVFHLTDAAGAERRLRLRVLEPRVLVVASEPTE